MNHGMFYIPEEKHALGQFIYSCLYSMFCNNLWLQIASCCHNKVHMPMVYIYKFLIVNLFWSFLLNVTTSCFLHSPLVSGRMFFSQEMWRKIIHRGHLSCNFPMNGSLLSTMQESRLQCRHGAQPMTFAVRAMFVENIWILSISCVIRIW